MSFTEEQISALRSPLDKSNVKSRAQAGQQLSYIEAWKVIEEANRIFGFDGWTRETILLEETSRELVKVPGYNGKPDYDQWRLSYIAKVRVTVGEVVREGTGFGSGMGKPIAIGDAIEGAIKEAESDAMKRAFMTFGNPFGLALYDKTQANVADAPPPEPTSSAPTQEQVKDCGSVKAAIMACKTVEALKKLAATPLFGESVAALHPDLANEMRREWSDRKAFLADREERKRVEASNDELTGGPPVGNGQTPQSESMVTG